MATGLQRAEIAIEQFAARIFEPLIFPARLLGSKLPALPAAQRSKRHPVILVHGVADSAIGSQTLAASLRRDGWTVFTPTMPGNGLYGIRENSEWIAATVTLVQALTGARLVDLVGHSQGGLGVRYYVSVDGGAKNVGRVVTINAPLHGVGAGFSKLKAFLNGLGIYRPIPDGLIELVEGSDMLKRVEQTHLTPNGPRWTSLYSADKDGIINPPTSPILEGARNIALVEPGRRLLGGTGRGPTHIDSNQRSEEAYRHLRAALLGESQTVAAAAGAHVSRARRRGARHH
jgi:triacylglycerol esterase/lipase EstA (alpha/beta hydrolase family)